MFIDLDSTINDARCTLVHVKLNVGAPWKKQHSTGRRSQILQVALKTARCVKYKHIYHSSLDQLVKYGPLADSGQQIHKSGQLHY